MAYTPKGKGSSLVKEVVDKINGLGIFPNDHKFLCRVAWVESKYGQDAGTYRSGYHGGIWQVLRVFDEGNYEILPRGGVKRAVLKCMRGPA